MKPVFTVTKGMLPVSTSYCPGCTHGVAHRIIMETLDEMGLLGKTLGVAPIGCSVVAHQFMNVDMCEAAHGRAPAVASGIRRVHPDKVVFTYQGDGDLASIGMGEIVHAAARGELFSTFFINNGIYGMTGGQMAPTTLMGMKTSTTPYGRNAQEHGYPMHMCEVLNTLTAPSYLARVTLIDVPHIKKAKEAVRQAIQHQLDGKGFSMVEFVSNCPTNWGLTPQESLTFIKEKMLPEYPLGEFRNR